MLVVQMATSSVGRYPRIIEAIALSHIGLAEDADDPQITRAVRGYVQILSALASRMVKFDLDADAQELVDNVKAFCARLNSACSLGLGCPWRRSRPQELELEYLKFRLEMVYFLAIREGVVGDPGIIGRIGDAEFYNAACDALTIWEIYCSTRDPSSFPQQPKRQRLTNETPAS